MIPFLQVVVFSWTRCPFCVKAKRELDSMNAKYLAVELDTMGDGNAIRSELAKVRMDDCCLLHLSQAYTTI